MKINLIGIIPFLLSLVLTLNLSDDPIPQKSICSNPADSKVCNLLSTNLGSQDYILDMSNIDNDFLIKGEDIKINSMAKLLIRSPGKEYSVTLQLENSEISAKRLILDLGLESFSSISLLNSSLNANMKIDVPTSKFETSSYASVYYKLIESRKDVYGPTTLSFERMTSNYDQEFFENKNFTGRGKLIEDKILSGGGFVYVMVNSLNLDTRSKIEANGFSGEYTIKEKNMEDQTDRGSGGTLFISTNTLISTQDSQFLSLPGNPPPKTIPDTLKNLKIGSGGRIYLYSKNNTTESLSKVGTTSNLELFQYFPKANYGIGTFYFSNSTSKQISLSQLKEVDPKIVNYGSYIIILGKENDFSDTNIMIDIKHRIQMDAEYFNQMQIHITHFSHLQLNVIETKNSPKRNIIENLLITNHSSVDLFLLVSSSNNSTNFLKSDNTTIPQLSINNLKIDNFSSVFLSISHPLEDKGLGLNFVSQDIHVSNKSKFIIFSNTFINFKNQGQIKISESIVEGTGNIQTIIIESASLNITNSSIYKIPQLIINIKDTFYFRGANFDDKNNVQKMRYWVKKNLPYTHNEFVMSFSKKCGNQKILSEECLKDVYNLQNFDKRLNQRLIDHRSFLVIVPTMYPSFIESSNFLGYGLFMVMLEDLTIDPETIIDSEGVGCSPEVPENDLFNDFYQITKSCGCRGGRNAGIGSLDLSASLEECQKYLKNTLDKTDVKQVSMVSNLSG